jgi:hypothetical protein
MHAFAGVGAGDRVALVIRHEPGRPGAFASVALRSVLKTVGDRRILAVCTTLYRQGGLDTAEGGADPRRP